MDIDMASDVKILDATLAERERVLRILREQAPQLRARGITHLSLFGSMARGEAGPESDVDLLIEIESAAKVGLFDLFRSS
jgi:predicted nucleotidyltransferase